VIYLIEGNTCAQAQSIVIIFPVGFRPAETTWSVSYQGRFKGRRQTVGGVKPELGHNLTVAGIAGFWPTEGGGAAAHRGGATGARPGPGRCGRGGPLPITSSKMSHLVDALEHAYRALGFEEAAGAVEVFRQLVMARIIEPSSKLDSLRVLDEAGVTPPSYRTLKRRLPAYAEEKWRERLSMSSSWFPTGFL